jgi:hypothetical protein
MTDTRLNRDRSSRWPAANLTDVIRLEIAAPALPGAVLIIRQTAAPADGVVTAM